MRVREVMMTVVLVEPENGEGWSRDEILDALGFEEMGDAVVSVEIPEQDFVVRDATEEEREEMCVPDGGDGS